MVTMDTRFWTGFLCLLSTVSVIYSLKIGAFNINSLTGSKLKTHPGLLDIYVKIMSRYDIAVIEEVMDTKGINDILQALNSHGGGPYALQLSGRLGGPGFEEYFAFLYRTDHVSVRKIYQYPDTHDYFEHEPFAILFHTTHAAIHDFAIAAVHIRSRDTVSEMNHLVDVYDSLKSHFGNENILFAGDLNADCFGLSLASLHKNLFYTDHRFHWLILSTEDTIVSGISSCAYDRFVVAGSEFLGAVVPFSAKSFHYDFEYRLNYRESHSVSDHYPIEMELR
ncbi:deoxyribonuclease-1-like isoform X1 [Gigantopelta aegis]|uniref:deoxyribonuclease-1-like isoform X1 n=1 Tax=Gigantopelta aegis TaxID=1735272 RepID=UPI001B88AB1B|nr:deoxyribonuclease-1-like isoform X1 [Gigantopelta aegis]XP_041351335.1 deoxyribonuclease-1-like isoform X1 [Gigantopelta aegis]